MGDPDGGIGFSGIKCDNRRDPDGASMVLYENEGEPQENRKEIPGFCVVTLELLSDFLSMRNDIILGLVR